MPPTDRYQDGRIADSSASGDAAQGDVQHNGTEILSGDDPLQTPSVDVYGQDPSAEVDGQHPAPSSVVPCRAQGESVRCCEGTQHMHVKARAARCLEDDFPVSSNMRKRPRQHSPPASESDDDYSILGRAAQDDDKRAHCA